MISAVRPQNRPVVLLITVDRMSKSGCVSVSAAAIAGSARRAPAHLTQVVDGGRATPDVRSGSGRQGAAGAERALLRTDLRVVERALAFARMSPGRHICLGQLICAGQANHRNSPVLSHRIFKE